MLTVNTSLYVGLRSVGSLQDQRVDIWIQPRSPQSIDLAKVPAFNPLISPSFLYLCLWTE